MRLSKQLFAILTAVGSLALAGLTVAQEKKDEKPAAPPTPPVQPQQVVPDRTASLAKYLNLTEEQRAKIKPILEQEITDLKALREDKNLAREARMTKWKEIRENVRVKVKPFLNDEQAKKWEQMRNPRQIPPPPAAAGQPPAPANPPAAPKPADK